MGLSLMAARALGQTGALPAFPKSSGKNLNGRALALPEDFAGRVNLVFVAFQMRQQQEVDSWKSFAQGMRSGIPDNDTRASTVTLYLDVQAFARTTGPYSPEAAAPLAAALAALGSPLPL
jgi:hypothetical protein